MFMAKSRYGVEVEFGGLTRKAAANVVAEYFSSLAYFLGGHYSEWHVKDSSGRTWKVVYDSSVDDMGGESCELVTPLLSGDEDLETLQEIIRNLRAAGAKVNSSCGVHVHVSQEYMSANALRRLAIQWYNKEEAVVKGVKTLDSRLYGYCKPTNSAFLQRTANLGNRPTYIEMEDTWYQAQPDGPRSRKYHSSRYHTLNFHSFFSSPIGQRNVEFRLFNGTLHAGKIKAYVQYSCAVVDHAINSRSAKISIMPARKSNLSDWFVRIGLVGDKYKTCRRHMLEGYAANA